MLFMVKKEKRKIIKNTFTVKKQITKDNREKT